MASEQDKHRELRYGALGGGEHMQEAQEGAKKELYQLRVYPMGEMPKFTGFHVIEYRARQRFTLKTGEVATHQRTGFIYILFYIYICVCVCVCVFMETGDVFLFFDIISSIFFAFFFWNLY